MSNRRPPEGTTMYSVHEHRYYIPNHAAPLLEYCVCSGTVQGFFELGYVEVLLSGKSPEGYQTPWRYRLSDIGKCLFYTQAEAEALAEQMTDRHERAWSWIGPPEFPMRRAWR